MVIKVKIKSYVDDQWPKWIPGPSDVEINMDWRLNRGKTNMIISGRGREASLGPLN